MHELAGVRAHLMWWGLWTTEACTPHPNGTSISLVQSIVAMKDGMLGFARDSDF